MRRNLGTLGTMLVVIGLFTSLFLASAAHAQAAEPKYVGKFTLTYPVRWGGSVLQPGDYVLTIKSTGSPIIAIVRKMNGEPVTYVMSGATSDKTKGASALLIKEKHGQFVVHSLALTDLGMVLIFDPSLANERVQEVREYGKIPVLASK